MNKMLPLLLVLACCCTGLAGEKRDPTRAALYSLALPGGGQIYNRAWLKAGLVIGVQGFLIGSAIHHNERRDHFRDLAANAPDSYSEQVYTLQSNDYRDKLNNDIWWIGITAALSVFDAYVDAHLADFDAEKEKLELRFSGDKVLLQYHF